MKLNIGKLLIVTAVSGAIIAAGVMGGIAGKRYFQQKSKANNSK